MKWLTEWPGLILTCLTISGLLCKAASNWIKSLAREVVAEALDTERKHLVALREEHEWLSEDVRFLQWEWEREHGVEPRTRANGPHAPHPRERGH